MDSGKSPGASQYDQHLWLAEGDERGPWKFFSKKVCRLALLRQMVKRSLAKRGARLLRTADPNAVDPIGQENPDSYAHSKSVSGLAVQFPLTHGFFGDLVLDQLLLRVTMARRVGQRDSRS